MELEEAISNLKETTALLETEIKNNNKNINATLDIEYLKSLSIVLQALEEKDIRIKKLETVLQTSKDIEFQLKASEQVHNYDVKMIDKLKGEVVALNKDLEEKDRQLKYLRSGEYYNQLRWERDMLQKTVDTGKLSEFDKEWLDFSHRNTELLEELEDKDKIINIMTEYIVNCDDEEMCSVENEYECDNGEHCKICVQRYFKKKVEESNEKL